MKLNILLLGVESVQFENDAKQHVDGVRLYYTFDVTPQVGGRNEGHVVASQFFSSREIVSGRGGDSGPGVYEAEVFVNSKGKVNITKLYGKIAASK